MQELEYSVPTTLAEAVRLVNADPEGVRLLGGGTDLLIQLRAGTRRARHLVDVKRIEELAVLACDARTGLRLGAAVPCFRLTEDTAIERLYPGLVEAVRLIGSTQIQSRATVGGNLCNGSPAADTTPALIALAAEAAIEGPKGRRTVPVEAFVTAPGRTVLAPGELLVEVHVPPPAPRSADCYQRFIPRNEMDIAVVGVGVALTLDAGGRCTHARVALGAVGPTPILATEAGRALAGGRLDDATIARAAEAAMAAARPITDMRAPADYRRELVGVLTRRVAAEAARRAGIR